MKIKYLTTVFLAVSLISCSDSTKNSIAELETEILQTLQQAEGTFAVWFRHLENPDMMIEINADTVFHAASTMKTPVMIELFRRAEAGEFSLSDSIQIENRFYSIVDSSEFMLELDPNADDPFERKAGEMATIYDLNHAMITYSSNIATNILIQLVGAKQTTETMRKLGAENIDVLRGVYDMKAFDLGLNNQTTARDLGIILEHIASGTAVSAEKDSLMVEILKDQFYKDVIPVHLPGNVTVANKTGFITGVIHDSAIVLLPDGQSYILVYLSKDLPDEDAGREIGSSVSEMIYRFVIENSTKAGAK